MIRRALCCLEILVGVLALAASSSALADDSAASIAAGGLVPRRETRIVMAKEVLRISDKKVVVDYDFRNDTAQDVTTEVAFPIPPYENGFPLQDLAEQSFRSFRLWVNGTPVHYEAEAKAMLNGKDVTGLLQANHVDVATFGHFVEDTKASSPHSLDLSRLSKTAREALVKEKLFDGDEPEDVERGLWTVHLQYHWNQTFPAHATVHIRHEYSPAVGFMQVDTTEVENSLAQFKTGHSSNDSSGGNELLAGFCADQPFLSRLAHQLRQNESQVKTENERLAAGVPYSSWVDFILTSANTWQRPIEDFTLIIERGKPEQGEKRLVSFCSPGKGKVEKLDTDHFQVHLTNFVPTSELHIGFFDVPLPKPAQPAVVK
jgi:hypothetical protein